MNKLAIIAGTGLTVAAVCAIAVAAMGVDKVGDHLSISLFDGESCSANGATATSRTIAWDGSDDVTIEVPANIHYTPGSGEMIEVKGNPVVLAHMRVRDGRIDLDCSLHHWHGERADITLPGRTFRAFNVAGLADMDLHEIDQDSLKISIAGKADVTASGKVNTLKLEIAGKGDARLKDLIAQKVDVDIAGRGDVETSPIEDADISIAGSGDVSLYTEPKHISSSILGSGNIKHLAGHNG